MSLSCDITGTNPLFKLTSLRYRINKPTEAYKLTLPQAGYKESVVVKKINASGGLDTLVNGTHFEFLASNRDTANEDLIRAAYPSFSRQLYDSFYIPVGTFGSEEYIDLIIEYQSAFPNILTSAIDEAGNPNGPTCTPDLLRQIISDILLLKGVSTGEDVNYSTAQSLPSPLVTDYTGVLPDNFISDEAHNILTNDGKVVVRPANGSFYGHELSVRDSSGHVLIPEEDYTVRGMDVAATKVCEHPSGVWRFIIITKNITGMVYISYHAFGGEVNVQNFLNIRDQLQDLKDYVNKGSFLTANNVGSVPLLQELVARVNTHDRYYRSLNMSGFRDMSNRYVALPSSSGSNTSHWYRIAYLYKQRNTNDDNSYFHTFTKDSARFKIRFENSGIILDTFVYANVMNDTLNLKVMEADSDTGSADPGDYSNLKKVALPQFRLVWRKDNDYECGAVLQVKIPIPAGYSNEIISIENHNKAGLGGWILRGDANGTDEVSPEDNTVLLPDGVHTWLSSGASSTYGMVTTYPDYTRGILIYAGCFPLKNGTFTLPPVFDISLNCKALKNLTFLIFDRIYGQYIKKTIQVKAIEELSCSVNTVFDTLDQSAIECKLNRDLDNNLTIMVTPRLGTKSELLHRFDLRQIYVNSTEE